MQYVHGCCGKVEMLLRQKHGEVVVVTTAVNSALSPHAKRTIARTRSLMLQIERMMMLMMIMMQTNKTTTSTFIKKLTAHIQVLSLRSTPFFAGNDFLSRQSLQCYRNESIRSTKRAVAHFISRARRNWIYHRTLSSKSFDSLRKCWRKTRGVDRMMGLRPP